MADKRTYETKAETPSENKARSATPAKSMRVRVVKAHDGIEAGAVLVRPTTVATMMVRKGYWEEQ